MAFVRVLGLMLRGAGFVLWLLFSCLGKRESRGTRDWIDISKVGVGKQVDQVVGGAYRCNAELRGSQSYMYLGTVQSSRCDDGHGTVGRHNRRAHSLLAQRSRTCQSSTSTHIGCQLTLLIVRTRNTAVWDASNLHVQCSRIRW